MTPLHSPDTSRSMTTSRGELAALMYQDRNLASYKSGSLSTICQAAAADKRVKNKNILREI